MGKQVTKWQSEDGSLHDSEASMIAYEENHRQRDRISNAIDDISTYQRVNVDILLDELTNLQKVNSLGSMVFDYFKNNGYF